MESNDEKKKMRGDEMRACVCAHVTLTQGRLARAQEARDDGHGGFTLVVGHGCCFYVVGGAGFVGRVRRELCTHFAFAITKKNISHIIRSSSQNKVVDEKVQLRRATMSQSR